MLKKKWLFGSKNGVWFGCDRLQKNAIPKKLLEKIPKKIGTRYILCQFYILVNTFVFGLFFKAY